MNKRLAVLFLFQKKTPSLFVSIAVLTTTCSLASTQASKSTASTQLKPSAYSAKQIGHALRWIQGPGDHNLCHGHFEIAKPVLQQPNPKPMNQEVTSTRADGPTILKNNGVSISHKNVITTQPGRWSKADKVTVYRHGKTGKIKYIQLDGHVSLEQPNQRIVADRGIFNYDENTQTFYSSLYRIYTQLENKFYNTWGKAQYYFRDGHYNVTMKHATYSTCNPISPSWHISATTMTINHKEHIGIAYNALLYLYSIPVFYSPYFEFATAPIRKTGFLYPGLSRSLVHGTTLSVPFYWNIAPNYDDLITPIYYQKNGILFDNTFRLLTKRSDMNLNSQIIFHDDAFNAFKKTQIASATDPTSPYIKELKSTGNMRGYFSFKDHTTLSNKIDANINVNYATDPYFLSNYSNPSTAATNTLLSQQLLNQANLNYNGNHWQASASFSGYQTLHRIDLPASSQYQRLPEIDLLGGYDHLLGNNSVHMNTQYTNFDYHSSYAPLTYEKTIGQRLHLQPQLTHHFFNAFGYLNPSFIVDNTDYWAQLNTASANADRQKLTRSRTIPITSLDAGTDLIRQFHFLHHDYIQTLEPHAMYLYVPYQNQDQLPNFDTEVLPFSYNQLFDYNGFSGPDRVQNTSQLSIGLTSRLLSAKDDHNLLTANLGLINYFEPRRVCTTSSCQADNSSISPLIGMLTAHPYAGWTVSSTAAWSFENKDINNATITSTYNRNSHLTFNMGLSFVHAPPPFTADNSYLISAGASVPIGEHLTALGYLYYNVNNAFPFTEFIGLQYDTCCWTLLAAYTQQYLGLVTNSASNSSQNQFDRSISIQFMLKGLSSFGDQAANPIISTGIAGYANPFYKP